jgi:hypothetical protein
MRFREVSNKVYLGLVVSLVASVLIGVKATGTNQWPGFGLERRYDYNGQVAGDIVTADFDHDGIPDVAVMNIGIFDPLHSQVSVLLGKGDGTLQAPALYAVENFPRKMAAGDFNGDGKVDLVVATSNEGSGFSYAIDVLLGNGDGMFQSAASYSTDGVPKDLAIGDFNQDGRSDIAVKTDDSLYTPAKEFGISIFLSRSDGTFPPATPYQFAQAVTGVAVGDFNNDGKLDVVTANNYDSTVSVLLGAGDGAFSAPKISPGPSLPSASIATADLNHDGKLDLIVPFFDYNSSSSTKGFSVLLGNGDGSFSTGSTYTNFDIRDAATGDFDGDGFVDLAVALVVNNYNYVNVFPGNGDGTFKPPLAFTVARGGDSLAVADFNGDGKPDLGLGHNEYRSFMSVLLNSIIVPEPCAKPGPTSLIVDTKGDATDGDPSHDIESLTVSETVSDQGESLLVFKLKVGDLHTIQPDNYWSMRFNTPFRGSFSAQMSSRLGVVNGNYDPDGTITFTISRRSCDVLPGDELTNIQTSVSYVSPSAESSRTFDIAPDISPPTVTYTLGGTNPCATPTPSPSPSPTATPTPTPSPGPQLLSEEGTGLAIALDSVTLMRDPFPLTEAYNFSPDGRTRIMIFASGLELLPGETASAVTAQGEDVQQTTYALPVEYVGKVPGFDWLTEIVVKLPTNINTNDKLWVSINLHGAVSNKVPTRIK